MSIDLEQFYEVFFEESAELLAEMEACLLGLDVSSPDLEDLNAIFRAAHSIKGGAGTFGFTDMTEMTHMLETLLDKLRKGELEVRSEMVDAFLKAGDVIKDQLAGHRGDGEADPAAAAAVCEELKRFEEIPEPTENISTSGSDSVSDVPTTPSTTPQTDESAEVPHNSLYQIEFSYVGLNVKARDNIFDSLKQLGTLEDLTPPTEAGLCTLQLTTSLCEDDVWETLAFVVDPTSLKIETKVETKIIVETNAAKESGDSSLDAVQSADTTEPEIEQTQLQQGYGFFPGAPAAPKGVDEVESTQESQEEIQHQEATEAQEETPSQETVSGQNIVPIDTKKQEKAKPAATGDTSIRVSVEKVDQMINLVGELVITQAMLAQTASQVDSVIFEKLLGSMNQLERNTRDLQDSVMSIRMMPISFVFSRYPRVVHDLASKLNKKVELKTIGEGTELDKGLIEKIADPLTHLVRNSLDHGVEIPEKRIAAGKLEKGTITLRAFHQGGSIVIEVGDDGAGLSREKILEKAKERGIPVNDGMSDQDVWMLIFEAGFSTAENVTDVSGRGVGMDVVKRNISAMGGRIEIDSAYGVGTRISIRLPLTLAILDGLSVAVGDQMFIVPLNYIIESLQPSAEDIKTVGGQGLVVQVRGEYLPVITLHEIFNLRPKVTEIHEGILVILEAEGRKAAMFVDGLVGQHQVVIKSLESNYRRVQGVSGATIMGDGRVALIIDTSALVMALQHESS